MDKGGKDYDLAIKAIREKCVRQGFLEPRDEKERKQAEEGPVKNKDLDCLKD